MPSPEGVRAAVKADEGVRNSAIEIRREEKEPRKVRGEVQDLAILQKREQHISLSYLSPDKQKCKSLKSRQTSLEVQK